MSFNKCQTPFADSPTGKVNKATKQGFPYGGSHADAAKEKAERGGSTLIKKIIEVFETGFHEAEEG